MGITETSNIYVKQDYVLGNTNYEIGVKHKAGNRLVASLFATFGLLHHRLNLEMKIVLTVK